MNSVLAYVETADEANGSPAIAPDESEPPAWFKDYISKLGPKPGNGGSGNQTARRPPSPAGNRAQRVRFHFEGCWHCGKKGHSRGTCQAFQKIMTEFNKGKAKEDWKLPPNYSGKYEEAKKRAQTAGKKAKVNALDDLSIAKDSGTDNDEWEDSDEDLMGDNLGQSACRALRMVKS